MIPEPAARRYAEAAYLIAHEAKQEDAWRDGLQSIAALFGDPAAERVFASSSTSAENKRQLVEKYSTTPSTISIVSSDPREVNKMLDKLEGKTSSPKSTPRLSTSFPWYMTDGES